MSKEDTEKYLKERVDLNEVIISWKSPSHPYKKRSKVFYQTIIAFTFLLTVIFFFLREFLGIGAILSIAFVVYVINSIPPIEVEHKITPMGFENAGKLYKWQELYAFWFEERWGQKILVVHSLFVFPPQIRAVVTDQVSSDKLKNIIGKYLQHVDKPPKTLIDKLSDWVAAKIPLEA